MFASKVGTWRHDSQHNDIRHNDIQHNDTQRIGIICDIQHNNTGITKLCYYAECGYTESECLVLFIVMLNLIMASVVILNVVRQSVTTPETFPRVELLRGTSLR
jgi:hypothetical protein